MSFFSLFFGLFPILHQFEYGNIAGVKIKVKMKFIVTVQKASGPYIR